MKLQRTDFEVPLHWLKDAQCTGLLDFFYPQENDEGEEYWIDQEFARATCRSCPAKLECLDYAISGRETEGIWSDTDPDERRKIRLKNVRTLSKTINEALPAIRRVAERYAFAQEVLLDAQSKMQALQSQRRA